MCVIILSCRIPLYQLTTYRIMLIDLYERPYSPEAYKSRAFIDRILALSGPDGGVVGGEDGVSTQRRLKDGGREAWDMIRRLRQKAWQKAGLNPEMLWTEKDQIEAGIASPAGDVHGLRGSFHAGSSSATGSSATSASTRQSTGPDRPVNDFNRVFYNMTRSHVLPIPSASTAAPRPSLLRYSQSSTSHLHSRINSTSRYNTTPAAVAVPPPGTLATPSMAASSPDMVSSSGSPSSTHAATVQPPYLPPSNNAAASPHMPFMDPIPPHPPPMGVPTPPSMVDPNFNFDWDQWDAVFGQHLPVADELMELDPVSGLEFGNFGVPAGNGLGTNDMAAAGVALGDPSLSTPWANNRAGNDRTPSDNWAGFSGS